MSHSTKSETAYQGPLNQSISALALFFRLQHVLDQLAGHLFGTDVVDSIGHSLLELLNFFPPRIIDKKFAVAWLLPAFLSLGVSLFYWLVLRGYRAGCRRGP